MGLFIRVYCTGLFYGFIYGFISTGLFLRVYLCGFDSTIFAKISTELATATSSHTMGKVSRTKGDVSTAPPSKIQKTDDPKPFNAMKAASSKKVVPVKDKEVFTAAAAKSKCIEKEGETSKDTCEHSTSKNAEAKHDDVKNLEVEAQDADITTVKGAIEKADVAIPKDVVDAVQVSAVTDAGVIAANVTGVESKQTDVQDDEIIIPPSANDAMKTTETSSKDSGAIGDKTMLDADEVPEEIKERVSNSIHGPSPQPMEVCVSTCNTKEEHAHDQIVDKSIGEIVSASLHTEATSTVADDDDKSKTENVESAKAGGAAAVCPESPSQAPTMEV